MTMCKARKMVTTIGLLVTVVAVVGALAVMYADSWGITEMITGHSSNNAPGDFQSHMEIVAWVITVIWIFIYGIWIYAIKFKEDFYAKKYDGDSKSIEYYSNKFGYDISLLIGGLITIIGLIGVIALFSAKDIGITAWLAGSLPVDSVSSLMGKIFIYSVYAFLTWVVIYIIILLTTRVKGAPPELKKAVKASKEEKPILVCPECGAEVDEDAEVCPKCGHNFVEEVCECPACGAEIPCDVSVCPECGAEFEEEEEEEEEEIEPSDVVEVGEEEEEQEEEEEEMCECPECGAEIPCDATSCPNCGVEFEDEEEEEQEEEEEEMCECPECGAEIPCDATSCPNCGVEFED